MAERIAAVVAIAFGLGAASWIVVRKPSFGPRTLRSGFLLCGIAYGLLRMTGPLMKAAVDAAGAAAALLLVVVPLLSFAFWSSGVLVRAFVARARPPADAN